MKMIMIATILLLIARAKGDTVLDLLKSHGFKSPDIQIFPSPIYEKYDFIVIGAGSGGSTVANRLSENPEWKILLLEAGGPEGLLQQVPMFVVLFPSTHYNWGYKVEPQKNACFGMKNHQCTWPRGKCLGGTSTLNYMIHTRGNQLDYEQWEALGNYGWSYNDVLPYFKKSEVFDVPMATNMSYHGTTGYLCVEHVPYHSEVATQFLKAGKRMGHPIIDYNGPEQLGYSYLQVNMDKGTRCSASKAYLTIRRPNLDIVTNAQVTKILIDNNKRAYGVKYVKLGVEREIYASKEVILSAGTIDSAKLLMLSGIGPREHLQKLGIKVLKDSRVGYNLYEHVGFLGLVIMVNQSVPILPLRLAKPSVLLRYATKRDGPLSIPGGAEALAFIRTKYATDSRPDVELLFASASLHSDNGHFFRKGHGVTDELYNAVFKPIENQDACSIWPILQHPRSEGRIKLRSSDPFEDPIIEANLLNDPSDVEIILEGIKHAINIIKTETFQEYGARLHDIKIPGCVSYVFGSDDYWRCAIRHLPAMMNHEMGTVKMGPSNDPTAVVDPELRVYGIEGLRVVDASIMPKITVGHVNAVIFMIGEKAADMIKRTWH